MNLAERYIRNLKSAVTNETNHTDYPIVLWDYCIECKVSVHDVTVRDTFNLDNVNSYMQTTGEEQDISNLGRFGFYEMVNYWDQRSKFPKQRKRIRRALGPTKYLGNKMAQYILQANGEVVPQCTTAAIPPEHLWTDVIQRKIRMFDDAIRQKLGDSMNKSKINKKRVGRSGIPMITMTKMNHGRF